MVAVRGAVASETVLAVAQATEGQHTLEQVVRWGLAQSPVRLVEDVVVMDEFTHDVLVPWDQRVWLVYDTT